MEAGTGEFCASDFTRIYDRKELEQLQNQRINDIVQIADMAVNKLCEKGYIQKETDAADRKKVHLKLEESASEIIRFGQDCQRAFGESLFSGISREDREEFLRLCELIRRNVTEK